MHDNLHADVCLHVGFTALFNGCMQLLEPVTVAMLGLCLVYVCNHAVLADLSELTLRRLSGPKAGLVILRMYLHSSLSGVPSIE